MPLPEPFYKKPVAHQLKELIFAHMNPAIMIGYFDAQTVVSS